ncbi:MAG: GNAT family N-acetyltransferase [Selenomonadaceae bacterium]|nr:GNAT family N-acetyltransferase [Selenomonadaceae bacterium]
MDIKLIPTREDELEEFIGNIQASFQKGAVEEFGEDCKQVLPREDIDKALSAQGAEVLNIVRDNEIVGGAIVKINRETNHNELMFFYMKVEYIGGGIGYKAWQAIENRYPDTKVWETATPYFEKRNIHFYINKCGFHAVEFFNPHHPNKEMNDADYFFMFEKVMNHD